jgi:hypothetical protein
LRYNFLARAPDYAGVFAGVVVGPAFSFAGVFRLSPNII